MLKKHILACVLSIFGMLYLGSSAAATLSFSPSSTVVNEGDNFDVDVVISDLPFDDFLGAQTLVGAFDITVGFDSSIIASTGVSFSDALGDDPLDVVNGSAGDNVAGTVDAFSISLLFDLSPFQTTPSFSLATLSFQALSIGTTPLDFLNIIISDDLGGPIGAQGVSGDVSVVPLPGAVWLMLTGLLGIGAMARKNRDAVKAS